MIKVGTAGWAIPRREADSFPEAGSGSGLQRYAARFDCAEVNSTFHRAHRAGTLERWAEAVPDAFRFSVKLSREITHDRRLVETEAALDRAISEAERLGDKLGPLLIQLPPSLAFESAIAKPFFAQLRGRTDRPAALEPRHATWFGPDAGTLLSAFKIARVAADPARVPEAALPGGWPGLVYARLHGSPQVYRSPYAPEALATWAQRLGDGAVETWCVFDNTASGAAAGDALALKALLAAG